MWIVLRLNDEVNTFAKFHYDDKLVLDSEELFIRYNEGNLTVADLFAQFFQNLYLSQLLVTSPKADLISSSESPSRNIFFAT